MLIKLRNRKVSFYLKPILIVSLIYVMYQCAFVFYLSKDNKKSQSSIVGVHIQHVRFYKTDRKKFVCIYSLEEIDIEAVNDDYCDCADGTDEPGTNACPNGEFYCTYQTKFKNYPQRIPSSRVNDGICDCCDGSDEWERKILPHRVEDAIQKKMGKFQSPCPKLCVD